MRIMADSSEYIDEMRNVLGKWTEYVEVSKACVNLINFVLPTDENKFKKSLWNVF